MYCFVNMYSCYFKLVFLLKNSQYEYTFGFTGIHVDSTWPYFYVQLQTPESRSSDLKQFKRAFILATTSVTSLCEWDKIYFSIFCRDINRAGRNCKKNIDFQRTDENETFINCSLQNLRSHLNLKMQFSPARSNKKFLLISAFNFEWQKTTILVSFHFLHRYSATCYFHANFPSKTCVEWGVIQVRK